MSTLLDAVESRAEKRAINFRDKACWADTKYVCIVFETLLPLRVKEKKWKILARFHFTWLKYGIQLEITNRFAWMISLEIYGLWREINFKCLFLTNCQLYFLHYIVLIWMWFWNIWSVVGAIYIQRKKGKVYNNI